jgi:DNA-binding MarR family transcriptional regulator
VDSAPGEVAARATGGAPDDAAARLYVAIGRLVRMLRRTGTADVGPGAFSALAALNAAGPLRPGDLAAREGVSPPTMTRIIASLEAAGLAERADDPQDRRAVLVAATAAGSALIQGESYARSSALRRRVAGLAPADRAALVAALPVLEALGRDGDG